MRLTIIFPVLNEELRLERGIVRTVEYIENNLDIPVEILIVDNGSTDATSSIAKELEAKYRMVRYIAIRKKGVGIAFRKGVESSESDIVGYMDIDLSTDIRYLGRMIKKFEKYAGLDYVNASRFHKKSRIKGRKWYRQITSYGFLILLKLIFNMRATDAICGFTFVRREIAEALISECYEDNGWFYMVEFLLRAERDGYGIYDMPIMWEEDYNSTVHIGSTTINYIKNIVRLKRSFIREKKNDSKNRSKQKL